MWSNAVDSEPESEVPVGSTNVYRHVSVKSSFASTDP